MHPSAIFDDQHHCPPWVPDPLRAGGSTERIRGPSGGLSMDEHRQRAAGAPGLASQVPDPLRVLVAPQNASAPPPRPRKVRPG